MLDVHPPEHTPHTWGDFFIHISTICIGLLLAIALEQSVEYLHHRHQRQELAEQMRTEAQQNIPLIQESMRRLVAQAAYLSALESTLQAGKVTGNTVAVTGIAPSGGSVFYISPSRAAWSTAQTAGIAALLPPDQSKLYARLDYEAAHEMDAEDAMELKLQTLVSTCVRAHYDHTSTNVSQISVEHRDDVLFQLDQLFSAVQTMTSKLGLLEGADEAIVADVHSLDQMYAIQNAVLARIHESSGQVLFYGGSPTFNDADRTVPAAAPAMTR